MTNRFMISVAALALVAGTGLANAQNTMGRDNGATGAQPMQQHSQPAEHGNATGKHEKGTVGQAGGSGTMKSGAAEDKSSGAMKNDRSGTMNKNQAAEDKAGATKGQRTDERAQSQQDKSKSMSSETQTKSGSKDMKAEGRDKSGTTSSTNNAENRQGTGTSTNQGAATGSNMNAQGQQSGSSTTVGQAGAAAKLSTEQRTQITSVIREERVAPVTNVNFAISVGTRVPRSGIELHVLPSRVVTIYPEWRSYKYILVRDEIVIVDPNTYEIVAVLNA